MNLVSVVIIIQLFVSSGELWLFGTLSSCGGGGVGCSSTCGGGRGGVGCFGVPLGRWPSKYGL